jgi:glycolate oxidase FAD binding subunit
MDAVRQSKLTPAAVQIRMGSGSSTKIEILFEGTSAGVALQTERFRDLSGGVPVREERLTIWKAREELWVSAGNYAIAKLSVIPSEIANVSEQVGAVASDTLEWQLVWYSTGLGWLRLGGESAKLQAALGKLRTKIEWQDGSLVILRQPPGSSLDAWGEVGTAKDLMRAIKKQFDPKGILNSGRFVAGI